MTELAQLIVRDGEGASKYFKDNYDIEIFDENLKIYFD